MFKKISFPQKNDAAVERLTALLTDAFKNPDALNDIPESWIFCAAQSPYLSHLMQTEHTLLPIFKEKGFDRCAADLMKTAFRTLSDVTDEETLYRELRLLKRRVALLTALADLTEVWSLDRVTQTLSALADTCVRCAVRFLMREAVRKGDITSPNKKYPDCDGGLFVLGMGKLGGKELNYSSDIDLIVLYDADKVRYVGKRDIASFAIRLTRALIAITEQQTADGYVFRTDLRLRPDPASTPIAISTQAAAFYYESFAQNWERAAFIKARPVAGDKTAARAFLKDIRPFVWRRSSDFYVLNQMYDMRPSSGVPISDAMSLFGHNIKLAQGGIREIEFFTQLQQLLWGGRDTTLRGRSTVASLSDLCRADWITPEMRDTLSEAYVFLRSVEHRLQMRLDEQTQTLPKTAQDMDDFARFCGFENADAFLNALRPVLKTVQNAYDTLFNDKNDTEKTTNAGFVFSGTELPSETEKTLTTLGFKNTTLIADNVRGWLSGRYRAMRSEKARAMISELFPTLFKALAKSDAPDASFINFDDFLKGLPSGVQLFSLFRSRPALIDLLAEITGQSPLLAHTLSVRPELFDAVLSPSFLSVPTKDNLAAELDVLFKNADGPEEILDAARRFVREKKFQTALRFLRGLIDVRVAGKTITDLADTVICRLAPIVIADFEARYGRIDNGRFAFILMGKGGSQEMSVVSDLDILFVYDGSGTSVGGKSSLPSMTYYARLAQKFINALSANTREGILFDIDMRLRPSGSSGPVATAFDSFKRYYETEAWTWEFQALTKARVVYAQNGFGEQVSACIHDILCRPRDVDALCRDVAEMRNKMRRNFPPKTSWDVKERAGGMTDIDFMAQYLQLAFAHTCPDILRRSVEDVLETAAQKVFLSVSDAKTYADRYRLLRTIVWIQALCGNAAERKAADLLGSQFASDFFKEAEALNPPYADLILPQTTTC